MVNPEKSDFSPSQVVQYLGVVIDARTFMASPLPDRVFRLQSTSVEFPSSAAPPASLWQSLLAMLSSLSHLVPGAACGCDRSSFAFTALGIGWILRLRCQGLRTVFGTFGGGFAGIASLAVSLSFRCPQIWTFGPTLPTSAHLEDRVVSGLWDQSEALLQSLPGCCCLCVTVSSTSSPFCQGPRWPCFATMSPQSPIH